MDGQETNSITNLGREDWTPERLALREERMARLIPFKPGEPPPQGAGRKKLEEGCRDFAKEGLDVLVAVMRGSDEKASDRIAAVKEIWNRGYGKAPQTVRIAGNDDAAKKLLDVVQQAAQRAHESLGSKPIQEAGTQEVLPPETQTSTNENTRSDIERMLTAAECLNAVLGD